jgi:tetratricopeptide (TPR) repeat protein
MFQSIGRAPAARFFVFLLMVAAAMATASCSGKSKVDKLYDEGMLFLKHRRYYSAIEKFEDALTLQPDNPRVLLQCADAYLKTRKPEQAILYAQNVLQQQPENDQASLIVGQSHLALAIDGASADADGRIRLDPAHMDAAVRIAGELRQRTPDSIEGSLLQARVDYYNGRVEAAERLYRLVLEKDADNFTANVGLIDLLMGGGQFVQAELMARKALETAPKDVAPNPAYIGQLSQALLSQARYDESYEQLEPFIGGDNKNPDQPLYQIAGMVLLRHLAALGHPVDQTAALDALTSGPVIAAGDAAPEPAEYGTVVERLARLGTAMKGIYRTLPDSWFFRAISYELQNDMTAALQHYQEAASRAPESQKKYRLALALACLKTANYSQAQQELSTLLKNFPGDFEARLAMAAVRAAEGSENEAIALLRSLSLEEPEHTRVLSMLSRLLVASDDPKNVEEGLKYMRRLADSRSLRQEDQEFMQAQALLSEGFALARQGNHKDSTDKLLQAEELLRHVVVARPDHVQAELMLSDLAGRRNDLFTSLAHARRAAALDERYLPRLARTYESLGQLEAAENVYRRLVRENPDAVGHAVRLAEIALQRQQPQEALRQLDAMIAARADDHRLYINRARALMLTQRQQEAIDTLVEATRKLPAEPALAMELSRAYLATGRVDEAVRLLRETLRLADERLTLMRAQGTNDADLARMMNILAGINMELAIVELLAADYAPAAEHAGQAEQLVSAHVEQSSLLRAITLLGQDDPLGAFNAVEKARAHSDKNPSAAGPFIQALALAAGGKIKEGVDTLAASKIEPDTAELFTQLIKQASTEQLRAADAGIALQIVLSGQANYARPVLTVCDNTLKSLPDNPFILSRKAESLRMIGDQKAALAIYEQLIAAQPANPAFPLVALEVRMDFARQATLAGNPALAADELEKSETLGRQALKLAPESEPALTKLAQVLQARNKRAEANGVYRQLINIDSSNWTAYNNLAWNLAQEGKVDEAIDVGEKALTIAPPMGPVRGGILDTVGWIEFQRSNLDRAVTLLKEAGLYAPNDPEVRFHLAQAYEKSGRQGEAVHELEAIIQATPGFPAIGEVREMLRRLKPDSAVLEGAAGG